MTASKSNTKTAALMKQALAEYGTIHALSQEQWDELAKRNQDPLRAPWYDSPLPNPSIKHRRVHQLSSEIDRLKESDEPNQGQKHDGGKPRYDLIPADAQEEFVKVLTFGGEKYGAENWRMVPDADARYFAAAQRHMWAWKRGETNDSESNLHHLAHAMCCISFLLENEIGNE